MCIPEIMSEFLKEDIANIKKPSLHFDLVHSEDQEPRIDSYLGGKPYITNVSELHTCPECAEKMDFVMQFSMPEKFTKIKKIYSFYYCFHCVKENKLGKFLLNVYKNPTEEAMLKEFSYTPKFKNHGLAFYPAYEIPEWEYLKDAFPDFHKKLENIYGSQAVEAYVQVEERVREYFHDTGYKFKGFPETIMYADVPECPHTGEKMEAFVSMESIPEIGLNWLGKESYMILFKSKNHDTFAIRAVDFAEEFYDDLHKG